MEDIAKAAGCSKVTLYNYYDTKASLTQAVLRETIQVPFARAAQLLADKDADSRTRLLRFALSLTQTYFSSKAASLYQLFLCSAARSPDMWPLLIDGSPNGGMSVAVAAFVAMMREGVLAEHDPEYRARQFLALVKAKWLPWTKPQVTTAPDEARMREMALAAVDFFLRGAATVKGDGGHGLNADV